jgi:hypothetical protein
MRTLALGLLLLAVSAEASFLRRRTVGGVTTFASDTFAIDGNPVPNVGNITWTQVGAGCDNGTTNLKAVSGQVIPDTSTFTERAMLATFGTARTTGQYACVKTGASNGGGSEQIGACVAMSQGGGTANDMFCCIVNRTGVPHDQQARQTCTDDVRTFSGGANDDRTAPYYIGAERDAGTSTTFRCYGSNDGTTWTLTNTYTGVTNIDTPGAPGLFINGGVFNTLVIDAWQGGDGNPMSGGWSSTYAGACGTN